MRRQPHSIADAVIPSQCRSTGVGIRPSPAPAGAPLAALAGPGAALPEPYADETELLAPFPWGEALYEAWLFCQIDLHNGEIGRYQQSLELLQTAWRSLADALRRRRAPGRPAPWRV